MTWIMCTSVISTCSPQNHAEHPKNVHPTVSYHNTYSIILNTDAHTRASLYFHQADNLMLLQPRQQDGIRLAGYHKNPD